MQVFCAVMLSSRVIGLMFQRNILLLSSRVRDSTTLKMMEACSFKMSGISKPNYPA
jgi:hypothetical protein